MKTICFLMVALGNGMLVTTLNEVTLGNVLTATMATSVGLAGVLSWRWLLAETAAGKPVEIPIAD